MEDRPTSCPACGAKEKQGKSAGTIGFECGCDLLKVYEEWLPNGRCDRAYTLAITLRQELEGYQTLKDHHAQHHQSNIVIYAEALEKKLEQMQLQLDRWDQLRREMAKSLGADPETWPAHSNAPLAIAAGYNLLKLQNESLREELLVKTHGL